MMPRGQRGNRERHTARGRRPCDAGTIIWGLREARAIGLIDHTPTRLIRRCTHEV